MKGGCGHRRGKQRKVRWWRLRSGGVEEDGDAERGMGDEEVEAEVGEGSDGPGAGLSVRIYKVDQA